MRARSTWLERETTTTTDAEPTGTEPTVVVTPVTDGGGAASRARRSAGGRGTPGTTRATALARRTRDAAAAKANAEEARVRAMREGKKMSEREIREASERLYRGVGVAEREGGTTPRRRATEEDAAACTFTPKISAASRKLAQKFREKQQQSQQQQQQSRQQQQTDQKKHREKRNQLATAAAADTPTNAATLTTRERAELAEIDAHCTFTPTISRKSREIHASLVRRASSATKTPSSFVERSKVWARRKEEILEAEREAKREGDLRDCTFQPVTCAATSSSPMAVAKTPTPGLESYLARQERARKMREERDAKLNRLDGSSWRNETTVPQEFSFHTTSTARAKGDAPANAQYADARRALKNRARRPSSESAA